MGHALKAFGEFFLELIETIVIALSIFLVVYLLLVQPHQVNGESMVPTFQNGEYLLTDKISYRLGQPSRGDIIVFHAPENAHCPEGTGCDFIKRIIALPGETISLQSGQFVINGQVFDEPYLPSGLQTTPGNFIQGKTITLGADQYFAVGDNRPYSSDSRAWGPITKSDIVGKAFFRYWPLSVAGLITHD